ncbi:MAG: methyltransferase domain-containing protein [Flavobacteriales bacterium]|nr:methyltransferase domain-containing protein [Flavobacteriales bacterium]
MMNRDYWTQRWTTGETRWDIGRISTPLKNYFDTLENKDQHILIPGCGNSYEGEYLWNKGFKNLVLLDISEQPLLNFHERVPEFPQKQLWSKDFFEIKTSFDLVVEQTFFCAINPSLRSKYVQHMSSILNPGGKIAGLLFDFPLTETGPPFGGSKEEYTSLFDSLFSILRMDKATDSIEPRAGNELFIELQKT